MGRVQFHISECNPEVVIRASEIIRSIIDDSVGICNHAEWDYFLQQGQIRIDIQFGAVTEYIQEAMEMLKNRLLDYLT